MNDQLGIMLSLAVPLRIVELRERGGPTDEDFDRAREFAPRLAEKGDVLQFGGGKKGECAELFNELARSLAVMAFVPGGVKFGKERWEESVMVDSSVM